MDQAGKYIADAVLGSTRFGAAMSCVPRARGASLPTHGFPMSHCPLPTRIQLPRFCANRAACREEMMARHWTSICAPWTCPAAIAGVRDEAAQNRRIARLLSERAGGLPGNHVGPCHRDAGKGVRCPTSAAWKHRRKSSHTFKAGAKAEPRCRVAGPRRYSRRAMRHACWRRSTPGGASAWCPWHPCALWARP